MTTTTGEWYIAIESLILLLNRATPREKKEPKQKKKNNTRIVSVHVPRRNDYRSNCQLITEPLSLTRALHELTVGHPFNELITRMKHTQMCETAFSFPFEFI